MSSLTSKDLQRIFQKLDKNGDGLVSLDELNWLLERIGVQFSIDELASIVSKPTLGLKEFLLFYESISKKNDERAKEQQQERKENDGDEDINDLVRAFEVFDLDGDGVISCEELQNVLARLGLWDETSGKLDCRRMIRVFDTNLDGVLDFDEFKNMMLHA